MDVDAVILTALEQNQQIVNTALEGLTPEELKKQPSAESNPIGWLVWHMTRSEDSIIARITGQPQVWIQEGWHKKFGMEAVPSLGGAGQTPEQVATFQADLATLQGYAAAVRNTTKAYLQSARSEDLEKQVASPRGGTMPAGRYLGLLLMDCIQHGGQIAYLRGLYRGKGWLPF